MTEAETYMRNALEAFVNDPPDNDFQDGYLEALIIFATDGLGIPSRDELILRAMNCTPNAIAFGDVGHPFVRRRFQVIDGGKPPQS